MRGFVSVRYFLLLFLAYLSLGLVGPSPALAGCGCDKPPPPPAAVIPQVAFGGMPISIFHTSFKLGQKWQVVFRNGSQDSLPQKIKVLRKRDISDPTGQTKTLRLTLALPLTLPKGPTSIIVSRRAESFTIPAETFTVIGTPIVASEQNIEFIVHNYTTGVGSDGVFYLSLGGLQNVCQPMKFHALTMSVPLRYSYGDVVVINSQGFLIESLGPATSNHFFTDPKHAPQSDRMTYWRHSFMQYCIDHRPGGPKALDRRDPNWHKDGTPHVDYTTLIFAFAGHYDNQSVPAAGQITTDVKIETELDDQQEGWESEKEEEDVHH
jgi:hypothetical protein